MKNIIKLVKYTIEYYLQNNNLPQIPNFVDKKLLDTKSACFVSIHTKDDDLRGCIGTLEPVYDNLVMEIIHNAISASMKDPRFSPITKDELPNLVFNVDILSPASLIKNKDELDPKKYGVIVSIDYRKGILLPDLEEVDTVEQQLEIACSKAGISQGENFDIYKFSIDRIKKD